MLFTPVLFGIGSYQNRTDGEDHSGEQSSATNRANKRYAAHLGVFGGSSSDGEAKSLYLTRYVNSDNLVELLATRIDYYGNKIKDGADLTTYQANRPVVQLTHFWGNSFYTSTGLGVRASRTEVQAADSESAPRDRHQFYRMQQTDVGPRLSVGNRWQWDVLSLGCDWAGIYVPLKTISKSEVEQPVDGVDAGTREAKLVGALEKAKGNNGSDFGMLEFTIGMSF